ncbi:MAG TPA: hypothetical protein IAB44_08285 [Candidatus Limivivens intestinipullorum]|uniref:Uncharacterized protein n=1 Tax=Candidatus Limivivens intestinipullorum TaxID=2840858 RepID=A0A9D1ESQ6_9FIRM|nr:hypothetical protein [Candidatus Limivivens intestinipullorum]
MNEGLYKTMKSAGTASLVTGIVIAAAGLACGILMIVYGGKLLKGKNNVLI